MLFKRLSDQWDYEAEEIVTNHEKELGVMLNEGQRRALLKSSHAHRFTIPKDCHWSDVLAVSENIGEALTKATKGIVAANTELVGVFTVDWISPPRTGMTS